MDGQPRFVKSPNLPEAGLKLAAVGEAYASEIGRALTLYGVELLVCPKNPAVDARLSSHIDLSVFHLGENSFFLSKHAAESSFASELRRIGAEISVSEESFAPVYPGDAFLCALSAGGKVFHNTKFTDRTLKSRLADRLVHVAQGYAKCAVCLLTESAAMSADRGMISALRACGMDVLEISRGFIGLEGFAEGFIGGAAFKIAPDILAFTGTLERCAGRREIEAFLQKHGIHPVYLTDRPLFDLGSVIPILEK